MTWLISLHKEWVKSFLEGEKSIELRTRVPKGMKQDDIIIVAQTGTHNRVVIQMSVQAVIELSPDEMFDRYCREIQVNYLAYKDYTKGRKLVYGIQVHSVTPIKGEKYCSDFGIDKAPQWFRKIKKCDHPQD